MLRYPKKGPQSNPWIARWFYLLLFAQEPPPKNRSILPYKHNIGSILHYEDKIGIFSIPILLRVPEHIVVLSRSSA